MSRPPTSNFCWPPSIDLDHITPTASPLYIPPPETQHIHVKFGNNSNEASSLTTMWVAQQNCSAPKTANVCEPRADSNISESSTSASITATTSTAGHCHNAIYQSQTCNVTHNVYDQPETEYGTDIELDVIQNYPYHSFSSVSTDFMPFSGKRSVEQCSEAIGQSVDTYQLVNYIKELSPAPQGISPKLCKHVEFDKSAKDPIIPPVNIVEVPHTPPFKALPPSKIPNPVPRQWISPMVQALTTVSDKTFHLSDVSTECYDCEILPSYDDSDKKVICARPSSATNLFSQSEEKEDGFKSNKVHNQQYENMCSSNDKNSFQKYQQDALLRSSKLIVPVECTKPQEESISLPNETSPYIPSAISMVPYENEELASKSHLVEALTIAPFRSYTPFDHDVISQLEDLPTPNEELTFLDALTVAPTEPVIELNQKLPVITEFEKITIAETKQKENLAEEVKQIIANTLADKISQNQLTSTTIVGFRSVNPFTLNSKPDASKSDLMLESEAYKTAPITPVSAACTPKDNNSKDQHPVSYPPPPGVKVKSYVQSGLHKPENIPKYQRQWFNLPTQSPIRTPEPLELKENVPLAFIDTHHHKHPSQESSAVSVTTKKAQTSESCYETTIPVTIEEKKNKLVSGSVSMPFQQFETNCNEDIINPISLLRPHTPSLINKPAPTIPYYQQNLVAEECPPSPSLLFIPNIRSPTPDRSKSPAPGPPPNPLRIHAPRLRSTSSPAPSELTHSALNQLQQLDACQSSLLTTHSGKIISQDESITRSEARTFENKPEIVEKKKIGNLNIEIRSKECASNEQNRSDFQNENVFQAGNVQVQRKTRVVEEFEHSQKAKSVEICKSSDVQQKSVTSGNGISRTTQLTSLASSSQAYCATVSSSSNQQSIKSSSIPQKTTGYTELDANTKESFVLQQARRLSTKSQYAADLVAYNSKFPNASNTIISSNSTFPVKTFQPIQEDPKPQTYNIVKPKNLSLAADQQIQSNTNAKKSAISQKQSLSNISSTLNATTTAIAPTTPNTSQESISNIPSKASVNFSTVIPVPAFKPPLSTANDFKPNQMASQFKPQPSSGQGFKPPIITPSAVVSDPSPASAGPNKGMTFGATSTPRRGRGILNKAAIGGRIPQCGCCNAQIR